MNLKLVQKNWKPVFALLVFSYLIFVLRFDRGGEQHGPCESKTNEAAASKQIRRKFLPVYSDFRWCPVDHRFHRTKIKLDCDAIFDGDEKETNRAKKWQSPCSLDDDQVVKISRNCSALRKHFPFWADIYRIPKQNVDYPLAFVVIGARNAEQILRLMQSVYVDNNVYCLTYDNKASTDFKETLRNIQSCYPANIVLPEQYYDIYWSGYGILQSAMECLRMLVSDKVKISWRYVQILSWNDFPLRTNEEFVKIMKVFNGAQDSFLDVNPAKRSRLFYKARSSSVTMKKHLDQEKVNEVKRIPPGNMLEFKGSLATTMTREFVEFQFQNEYARQLYVWLNSSFCAEEIYWSTLIHNVHINAPGNFPGACLNNYEVKEPEFNYISRYQEWVWGNRCNGRYTFLSCVYGVGDLWQLSTRPELVAHKLYLEFEPATLYCLAQSHFNRTFFVDEYEELNLTIYENLPAVRYRNMKNKDEFKC